VRTAIAATAALLLAPPAWSSTARAAGVDDLRAVPDAPRPPFLPELTHPDGEASLEVTSGAVWPRADPLGHVPVHIARIAAEQPIGGRHFFAGATYEGALGAPDSARAVEPLGGNAELSGRAIWATSTGLAFGGGAAVVLPTASFGRDGPAAGLARAAISLRPFDAAFFDEGSFALHPFLDVRTLTGPLVLQLRQSFRWSFDVRGGGDVRLTATATLYAAVRATRVVALGVEAYELYLVEDASVTDEGRRLFFALSPNVRLMLPRVQPMIGVLTSIGPAYLAGAEHMFAARAGVTVLY